MKMWELVKIVASFWALYWQAETSQCLGYFDCKIELVKSTYFAICLAHEYELDILKNCQFFFLIHSVFRDRMSAGCRVARSCLKSLIFERLTSFPTLTVKTIIFLKSTRQGTIRTLLLYIRQRKVHIFRHTFVWDRSHLSCPRFMDANAPFFHARCKNTGHVGQPLC